MTAIVTDTWLAPIRTSIEVSATQVQLAYEPNDPYAVHLLFPNAEDGPVEWVFARQLLTSGCNRETGEGHVKAWPVPGFVRLSMRSHEGEMELDLAENTVRVFLLQAYMAVRDGRESEHLDVDRAIALLREDA